MIRERWLVVLGLYLGAASGVAAQGAGAPSPAGGTPAALPELRLPSVQDLRASLPRSAKAAAALAGLGRQRLALVVGLGTIGHRVVVTPAARDAQAVATALRGGGFVVMRRDDVSGDALRDALAEFRSRLQPEGVGFVYVAALGAQLEGINLLLPRDTPLAATPDGASAALSPRQLQAHGVPLAEVVAALAGPPESLRLLVVDAAYRHPALAALPQPGLTEQPLPPGVMALFGHGLQVARDIPATATLPEPAPADPAEIAAITLRGCAGRRAHHAAHQRTAGAAEHAPGHRGRHPGSREPLAGGRDRQRRGTGRGHAAGRPAAAHARRTGARGAQADHARCGARRQRLGRHGRRTCGRTQPCERALSGAARRAQGA
jgi:hypothetical protein